MKIWRSWKLYRLKQRLEEARARERVIRPVETTRELMYLITKNARQILRLRYEIDRLEKRGVKIWLWLDDPESQPPEEGTRPIPSDLRCPSKKGP